MEERIKKSIKSHKIHKHLRTSPKRRDEERKKKEKLERKYNKKKKGKRTMIEELK